MTRGTSATSIEALVELCEAQRETIEAFREALAQHARQGTPRSAIEALGHELGTPLTAIIGMLQLVRDRRLPATTEAEYVQRALQQSQSMAQILKDVVAVADGEVFVRGTEYVTVRLADLVADAMEAAWSALQGRRIDLDVPTALSITTVPDRVRRILTKLIMNAVQYSPAGTAVRVTGRVDRTCAVLEVSDRGPGVVWEHAEELFLPFRGGANGCRGGNRSDGLGLGLYLVRRLAELLDGTATLVPREGGGTVARVVLPQRRPGEPKAP